MQYPEVDSSGELVCIRSGSDMQQMLLSVALGNALLIDPPPSAPSWWDYLAEKWVQIPAKPSQHHEWDKSAKTWKDPRTVAMLRADRWDEIKVQREERCKPQTITVGARTWDTDQKSLALIEGAMRLAGIIGPAWSTTWTFADNTRGVVTIADLQAVALTLGAVTDAAFQQAAAIRDQINAAHTAAAINSITWPSSPT